MKRTRGRPRKFDEEAVVEAAGNVFWINGFSATSLDDLAEAMDMNRPSIYRAFGDKESLYRRALKQFGSHMEEAMQQTLFTESDVTKALEMFYRSALGIYISGAQPKGCLVMSTAVSAAATHLDVRSDLLGVIKTIDGNIDKRLRLAVEEGQLPTDFETSSRAAIAQSILHSLSLRARAGASRSSLEKLLMEGVALVVREGF